MKILRKFITFTLRQTLGDNGKYAARWLEQYCRDPAQALPQAIAKAERQTWQVLELALQRDSWSSQVRAQLNSGTLKAMLAPLQALLDLKTTAFKQQCLYELQQVRREQNFVAIDANQASNFALLDDPEQLVTVAEMVLRDSVTELNAYPALTELLTIPTASGPLLLSTFSFFLRQAIVSDTKLLEELNFQRLEQLWQRQAADFHALHNLLTNMAHTVQATHTDVLVLRQQMDILLQRLQAGHETTKPHLSFSLQNEIEQQLVQNLLQQFRALPAEQKTLLLELADNLEHLVLDNAELSKDTTLPEANLPSANPTKFPPPTTVSTTPENKPATTSITPHQTIQPLRSNKTKWRWIVGLLTIMLVSSMFFWKMHQTPNVVNKTTNVTFHDTLRVHGTAPQMVWIPAGHFRMGDIQGNGHNDERPVQYVSIAGFAMGVYEVTRAEFKQFVQTTGYHSNPVTEDYACQAFMEPSEFKQTNTHPVVCISWHDAQAYTNWLSEQTGYTYRLPTEAEWEYATRAGTETQYWWGNHAPICKKGVRYSAKFNDDDRCDNTGTAAVGFSQRNPWGLYDVHGNAWEWTCSAYNKSYDIRAQRCIANSDSGAQRVVRGGHWNLDAASLRSAYRNMYQARVRYDFIGFRVVREE